MICDVGFDIHAHRKTVGKGIYPNPGFRKTGSDARRALQLNSVSELRNVYLGISPHHKNMTKNWISADRVISDNIDWLMSSAVFMKIEETDI